MPNPKASKAVEAHWVSLSALVAGKIPGGDADVIPSSTYSEINLSGTAPAGAVYVYALAWKDGNGGAVVDDWCLTVYGGNGVPLPDLTLTNLSSPATVVAGTTFTANITVRNNGNAPTVPTTLQYLIALQSPVTVNVPAIAAGGEMNFSTSIPTAPDYLGLVYLQAEIDQVGNPNLESNEYNNETVAIIDLVPSGGACSMTASVASLQCLDNGTPSNPSDDKYKVFLNVSGTNTGIGWNATTNGTNNNYSYGNNIPLWGEFSISAGPWTLSLVDANSPTTPCSTTVNITPPAPCSNGGSPANLVITNVPCPANYPDWTQSYTWGVTVQNNGGTASQASPIYLYNYAPQAMGYTAKLLTTGNVPALAAGQSTTISLTAPASAHSPNPGSAGYGQDFLLTGQKGLSFTQVASGNAPLFNETNGFPNIYCKKFSTDLVVDVASTMTTVAPTQPLVFTVKVTNNGPVDAYNVSSGLHSANSGTPNQPSFSAQVTAGQVWQQNQAAGAGTNTSSWGWYIPFLAVGQSATATVTLTPIAGGTTWSSTGFTITKSANSGHNNDTNPANNSDQIAFNSGGGGSDQIDLSLVAQQLTANPAQWSNYPVKLTLSNAGPQAATGVKVKFAKPNGVVYVGGNTHTASQGTFNALSDEVWTVGSIPANGSATLTVNYFLLNATAPVAYAQVTAANETDTDSQPNNGTPPTPVQDDEAATSGGGGGGNQQPDLTIADLQIPTASVAAGAILSYNFDASNAGTAAVPGNFTIKSYISTDQTLSTNDVQDGTITTGNYAAGFSVQNVAGASTIPASLAAGQYYLIVKIDGDNAIAEGNENNNTVVKPFTVTGGGGTCSMNPPVVTTTCDDNGTPTNPADDLFLLQMSVTGTNVGSAWGINGPGTAFAAYNITVLVGAYPIADGPFSLTVTDLESPTCSQQVAIVPPASCSGGGNPCDNININAAPNSINIAGATAPHVLIKVFRPNWTVAFECLDGACANPTVVTGLGTGNHFVEVKLLNASWGEICKKTQTVGVTNIAQQDDRMRLAFDKFYPNPTAYLTNIELYSPVAQQATLDFYDRTGRLVHTQKVELEQGQNLIEQLVFDWKSGTYNVVARGEESALPAYGRFLKVWEE